MSTPDPTAVEAAIEEAWRIAVCYGELVPDEAQRALSVSGLKPHMALNKAQLGTVVHRIAPILLAAGRTAAAADIRDHLGPDPSPCLPAWWAGYEEAKRDAARIAEGLTP